MKIIFSKKEILFKNNIAYLFYNNPEEKEDILSELIQSINKGDFIYDEEEFDKFDSLEYVDLSKNLVKEFALLKTSGIRRKIENDVKDFFIQNEIENVFNKDILNELFKKIEANFNTEEYKIYFENKNDDATKLIDNLFKIKINTKDGEEINTKLNQWVLSPIYLEMMLDDNIKNKIIIINNYDSNEDYSNEFINKKITKLIKNNLVLLITRKNNFFKNQNCSSKNINIITGEDEIQNIKMSKEILKDIYLLNNDFSIYDYDIFKSNSDYLTSENELQRMENILFSAMSIHMKDLVFKEKSSIDLTYLNDELYYGVLLFLDLNSDLFKNPKITYSRETKKTIKEKIKLIK
ncbi:MAG: hypothetical protein TYPL_4020 [Candidatus Tyloplasma litorale]|nr:MAG: hypothetical protein TYPL_4020 [Mycoplasmatales bacterium]